MVAPLDDVRSPMVAKPPGAVGSIGATSAPGVIGAASVIVVGLTAHVRFMA